MKIALLNSTNNKGGSAIIVKRLHHALLKQGVESNLLYYKNVDSSTLEGEIPIIDSFFKKLEYIYHIKAEEFILRDIQQKYKYNFSNAQFGVDISKHPIIQQADIIHFNWINHGYLSLKSIEKLFQLGKPVVWTLHDMWALTGGCHFSYGCEKYQSKCNNCYLFEHPEKESQSNDLFNSKKDLYSKFDIQFISPTQFFQKELIQSKILSDRHKIDTISNPIDMALFFPISDKNALRSKNNVSHNKVIYGFGALNVFVNLNKGINTLLEAFKQFQLQNNFIGELIVFGTGVVEERDLGDGVSVKLLGNIEDKSQLNEIYNCMDWYVTPSLAESFGLTIAEANACKVPAIGFLAGGVNDIIEDTFNGFGSHDFTRKSLLDLLNKTLLSKEAYLTMSENAFKKVLGNYSTKTVTQKHLDLYKKLLTTK